MRYSLLRSFLRYIGFYIAIFSHDNGDRTSLRQTLSYSSYLLTETLGYNNKSETSRTWVKNSRFRDRNKCTKNEAARLFVKDAEISRLDEKFARPTIFEIPFATPFSGIDIECIKGRNELQKALEVFRNGFATHSNDTVSKAPVPFPVNGCPRFIEFAVKSISTLRSQLVQPKDAVDPAKQDGLAYRIPCECGKVYIGETGRPMQDRIKEHDRDIRFALTQTSAFSEHTHNTGHHPLWNEVNCIDRESHCYTRRAKEAIHIRLHANSINRDSGIEIPEAWMPTEVALVVVVVVVAVAVVVVMLVLMVAVAVGVVVIVVVVVVVVWVAMVVLKL